MILSGSKDTKKSSGYGFSHEKEKPHKQIPFYIRRKPDYSPLHELFRYKQIKS